MDSPVLPLVDPTTGVIDYAAVRAEALRLIEHGEVCPAIDRNAAQAVAERLQWVAGMAAYRAAQIFADELGGMHGLSDSEKREYAEHVAAGVHAALCRPV